MEHRVAKETNAVERYLLDEFTPEERSEFEEHLFDCTICGEQVRDGAIAIANVKEVMREEQRLSEASRQRGRNQGWGAWFRMPALIPSMAALALAAVAGYQSLVRIPALEQAQAYSNLLTIAPQARGQEKPVETDAERPMFVLTFDVDAAPQGAYTCEFRGPGGAAKLSVACKVASGSLDIVLPTKKFPTGVYTMSLHPAAKPETEVQQYSFAIQRGHT